MYNDDMFPAEERDEPRPLPEDLKPYVDPLPLPTPVDLRGQGGSIHQTVTLQPARVRYSRQLGTTDAWAYDGRVPGPAFVLDRGQTVHTRWHNTIDAALPYRVVVCPDPVGNAPFPQNAPGADCDQGKLDDTAAKLRASTVTHLHGGRTAADSDGWTENVAMSAQSQHTTYENNQPAAMLWYHDHGMGVTRLNVYAGLFGLWILRDDTERRLVKEGTLPGEKDELFLLIQDRNFDTDDDGRLTGALLHKTEAGTAEMFGPYTLVNGALWPQREITARPKRLRILNGSNARTYCLRLVTVEADGSCSDDVTDKVPIWQVGTDGGLLDFPVALPDLGLLLAPAERADLVIDFSQWGDRRLALVNTAFAPFHRHTVTCPGGETDAQGNVIQAQPAGQPCLPMKLPFPQVLRFDIRSREEATPSPLTPRTPLDPDFVRYVHDKGTAPGRTECVLPPHQHRWIALTENPPGNLLFRELEEVPAPTAPPTAADPPLIQLETRIPEEMQTPGGPTTKMSWFRTLASAFHDTLTIVIPYDSWEVWNILNLTVDTHPIHVHLVQFQPLQRQLYQQDLITLDGDPIPPDANEQGFKDTVRVNPNEVLSLAAHFDGYCGRYMYHCHILEHEDHDMMRPIQVMAADALAVMNESMGGMGGMPPMHM